jgi:hypothetical protein
MVRISVSLQNAMTREHQALAWDSVLVSVYRAYFIERFLTDSCLVPFRITVLIIRLFQFAEFSEEKRFFATPNDEG